MPQPLKITHIHLNKPLPSFPLPAESHGVYVAYWWKDIPLGHSVFEAGSSHSEKSCLQQMANDIAPAINHYKGNTADEWQGWIQSGNFAALGTWLQQILETYEPKNIPAEVPVSVIICTRNRATHLERCLHSLADLTSKPRQIVVVDNAPSDNSTAAVAARFPHVTYVREEKPGLDIARNTGALAASCPIVAYTDDDVHLHPLWAFRLWEAFEQRPQMAALTGLVIADQLETEAQQIFEKFWSFNRGYTDKRYDNNYYQQHLPAGPPVWEIGAGANMAFRKDVFEKVGYFDELLDAGKAGCNGDSEMWFRILSNGLEIGYNPRVIAFHEHRRSMAELQKQIFHYMRGFTVAALLQQDRFPEAQYRRQLTRSIPVYHFKKMVLGFPRYRFGYSTISAEVRGVFAGFIYYAKNKKRASIIPYNAK